MPPYKGMSTKAKANTKLIEFNRLILNRCTYNIGDSVILQEKKQQYGYGKLLKIWRNPMISDAFARISWYYTANEVFSKVPEFISQAELFVTDHQQDISVQAICEKIIVLTLDEYHDLDEADYNVYFTRGFYNLKKKTISPPLSEWKAVCYCRRIVNPDLLYIKCDGCGALYHVECSEYTAEVNWYCRKCNN